MALRGERNPVRHDPAAPLMVGCALLLVFLVALGGGGYYWLSRRMAVHIFPAPSLSAPTPPPALASTGGPTLAPTPPPTTEVGHGSASDPSPGAPTIVELAPGEMVNGGLSHEVIARIVRRHVAEVRLCYEAELRRTDPSLTARVVAHFTIDATGAVSAATVDGSDDAALTTCIAARVLRWTFPAPNGGGVVNVNYPFVLSAS